MKLTELGYEFSELNACTIKRKNLLVPMITGIMFLCFGPIFIVFLILWITGSPVDFNGVTGYPGDPTYDNFFRIFLLVFGLVTLSMLIPFFLGIISKPKPYIYVDNSPDMDRFYYIYDNRHREEIYLTEKYVLVYRKRYQNVLTETNPLSIQRYFDSFIFWKTLESRDDVKVIYKNNKNIIKLNETKGRWRFRRSFSFSDVARSIPHKVTEIVYTSVAGNSNIKVWQTLYFEDVNRKPYFEMHPEIKKTLSHMI